MAVSDISPSLIVNERRSFAEYLWKIAGRELYVWDAKVTYRWKSGATPVEGQGLVPPTIRPGNVKNSQTSPLQFFWKIKDKDLYVWDARVEYRWTIGSTPVAGYPQPPARKTKQYPGIKGAVTPRALLWLIPVTGILRWDDNSVYTNAMRFIRKTIAMHAWTGAVDNSTSTRKLPLGTITNVILNPDMSAAFPTVTNAYRAKISNVTLAAPIGQTAAAALVEQDFADAPSIYYGTTPGGYPALPGQRWHNSVKIAPSAGSIGARSYTSQTRFYDSAGGQIATESAFSKVVTTAPVGVFHRWAGTADASVSERFEGAAVRRNEAIDPRYTTPSVWYSNPKGAYDYSAQGAVRIFATSAFVNGDIATYPSVAIPLSPGETRSARYRVRNIGTTNVSVYGTTRVYGSTVSVDSASTPLRTVAPGQVMDVVIPAVTATAATLLGYRPLLRAIMDAGGMIVVDQPIFEATSANGAPGPYFDGSSLVPISGTANRWVAATNTSPSEQITATGKRTNRATNPINGKSTLYLGASRGTLSQGEDFCRVTITDATAAINAQRIVIGTASGVGAIAVTPGETVTYSVEIRSSSAQPMSIMTYWYDRAGTYLSLIEHTRVAATAAITFTRHEITTVPPAGAVTMLVYIGTGAGPRAIGDTFDIRKLMIGDNGLYFDGSSASDATLPTGQAPAVQASMSHIAPAGTATVRAHVQGRTDYRSSPVDGFYLDEWMLAAWQTDELVPFFSGRTPTTIS